MNLLEATLALARKTKRPSKDICREIGVTLRWYQMVLAGEIREPSVVKIQRLHDLLVDEAESIETDAA